MEIVTEPSSIPPRTPVRFLILARNLSHHALLVTVLGSLTLHAAFLLAMRLSRLGADEVKTPAPKVVRVRILANPHGNPAVTKTKLVEIAKPKPKPKPTARSIIPKEESKPQPLPLPNSAPQSFGDDQTGGVVGVGESSDLGASGENSNWQPIEQGRPEMPREAQLKGIEGFVKFSIDINEEGRPENITVIEAENRSIFEANARKTLRKWRYAPRMINGQAVKVIGHIVVIEFKLTD